MEDESIALYTGCRILKRTCVFELHLFAPYWFGSTSPHSSDPTDWNSRTFISIAVRDMGCKSLLMLETGLTFGRDTMSADLHIKDWIELL